MSEEQLDELIQYNLDYSIEEDLEETKKCLKEANKEIERLNNIINRTTKYVESLSSSGRGCDIYEDIKQEILKELKGSDKEWVKC